MSRKLVVRALREARETGRSHGAAHVLSRAFHPSAGLDTGRASWQPTRSQPQPLTQPKPAGREAEERQSRASAQPEQRGAPTWQGYSLRLQD